MRWLSLLLFFCSFSVFAAQAALTNCTDQGFIFKDKQIYFNNDKPANRIFILHNISKGVVLLNHMVPNPGASAGWASTLDKNKWSALAMNQANFSMACMLYSPPQYTFVACKDIVSVCAENSPKPLLGFWIAENMPLEVLVERAKSRGINI